MEVNYPLSSKLQSSNETNLQYNIIKGFKFILSSGDNNSEKDVFLPHKLISKLESIFKSEARGPVFVYFLQNGAASGRMLTIRLDLPEATVYRCLRDLCNLGFISKVTKVRKEREKKGGPRATIYGLMGASEGDIAAAINEHHRMLSPKYLTAEELAQAVLTQYMEPRGIKDIDRSELVKLYRKHNNTPYSPVDLATLSIQYLKERGVKVWA